MKTQTCRRTPTESVAGAVSMGILTVGLLVTIANVPMAWMVWPVGYGLVLPLAIGYAKHREDRRTVSRPAQAETDDLARAKQRYVDGDINEAEFEARLEAALDEEAFR